MITSTLLTITAVELQTAISVTFDQIKRIPDDEQSLYEQTCSHLKELQRIQRARAAHIELTELMEVQQ